MAKLATNDVETRNMITQHEVNQVGRIGSVEPKYMKVFNLVTRTSCSFIES